MDKKSMRVLRFKQINRRQKILFVLISAILFLVVPAIKFIPAKLNLGNWYILFIIPVYLLFFGTVLGIKKGFCPSFVLLNALFFLPCGLIYNFSPIWQYMLFFLLFATACNIVAELLWCTRGHGKHSLDPELLSQDLGRLIKEDSK